MRVWVYTSVFRCLAKWWFDAAWERKSRGTRSKEWQSRDECAVSRLQTRRMFLKRKIKKEKRGKILEIWQRFRWDRPLSLIVPFEPRLRFRRIGCAANTVTAAPCSKEFLLTRSVISRQSESREIRTSRVSKNSTQFVDRLLRNLPLEHEGPSRRESFLQFVLSSPVYKKQCSTREVDSPLGGIERVPWSNSRGQWSASCDRRINSRDNFIFLVSIFRFKLV